VGVLPSWVLSAWNSGLPALRIVRVDCMALASVLHGLVAVAPLVM